MRFASRGLLEKILAPVPSDSGIFWWGEHLSQPQIFMVDEHAAQSKANLMMFWFLFT